MVWFGIYVWNSTWFGVFVVVIIASWFVSSSFSLKFLLPFCGCFLYDAVVGCLVPRFIARSIVFIVLVARERLLHLSCGCVFSWIYAFREQRKLRCEKTNKNTIFFISNWTNEKKNNFLKNQTALKRSAWLLYSIPSVLWYFCDANKRKATCLWNFWNVKPSPMCQWVNVFQCV